MRQQYHARPVGADTHVWDVYRLVRLSRGLEVQEIPLAQIAELDENWWYHESSQVPTPRAIAEHMALVQATDLAHPVILCAQGRLMDGMHRVVKAVLEDRTHIRAVRFGETPKPDFVNVSLDDLPYEDQAI